ncbi:glucan 1 4-alpha-glucosidase [Pyrenophora seminiperda CCB06]|uniref:Glucan 1 4-alpha-glucosidase n=1 Tax=Pyrenophora seminiperda CCB06 TaxID=1302712 RepID=A0A3M7M1L5_9PLEO|nr:glucan 1 4-alpha-glucosidase [Pyrenophora seminiperda CCB06]
MELWGDTGDDDPWAEDKNAEDDDDDDGRKRTTTTTTNKREVSGLETHAFTTGASGFASAFVGDDAGWGDGDGGLEGWGAGESGLGSGGGGGGVDSPRWDANNGTEGASPGMADTRIAGLSPLGHGAVVADSPRWDANVGAEDTFPGVADAWGQEREDVAELDNGTEDTSETPTTIQPDHESDPPLSRTSSETSRNEAPAESSRTSFEETARVENHSAKAVNVEEDDQTPKEDTQHGHASSSSSGSESAEGDYGTSTEDTLLTEGPINKEEAAQEDVDALNEDDVGEEPDSRTAPSTASSPTTVVDPKNTRARQSDVALLDELFPPHTAAQELEEAPDDPIYSVSGRKAWYRLTRSETMRESNLGKDDDNYVRVTWMGSQVRTEVNKIVGRWAREDRLSGKGPGARASFYWDTVAPVDPQPKGHVRTKTSVPTPRPVAPVRQSLPPVSANTPVAFAWSTSPTMVDPWKLDSPSIDTIVSHTAPKPIADSSQTHQLGTLSMPHPSTMEQTRGTASTESTETPAVAAVIAPPIASTISADPWGDFSTLDTTNPPAAAQNANVAIDDDEDWGEMISTPTVFTPTTELPSSVPAPHDTTPPALAATPETPLDHADSAEAMHAASIVRLQRTISPTSAVFGQKSFVPLHAEVGPIGPGILKPAKSRAPFTAAAAATQEKKKEVVFKPGPELLKKKESGFTPSTVIAQKNAPEIVKKEVPSKAALEIAHKDEEGKAVGAFEAIVAEAKAPEFIVNTIEEDDDLSAFVTSKPPTRPSTPPPPAPSIPTSEPIIDPWANADFSFFESALPCTTTNINNNKKPPPSSSTTIATTTPPPPSRGVDTTNPLSLFDVKAHTHAHARSRSTSAASSAKTFSRSSPPRNITPPPVQPLTGATNAAQRRRDEEDAVVRSVLQGLPDLGYMLRR